VAPTLAASAQKDPLPARPNPDTFCYFLLDDQIVLRIDRTVPSTLVFGCVLFLRRFASLCPLDCLYRSAMKYVQQELSATLTQSIE
jgi:hypothetical protein